MAVYAHDVDADVWDCELSDDDESSLFSALKNRPPRQAPDRDPAAAKTAAPVSAPDATPEADDGVANDAAASTAGAETTCTEQHGAAASSTRSQADLLVASGNTKQRRLKLVRGDQISWKFRETSGHRVDFSVFFVRVGMGPGDEVKVKPLSRCDVDTGTYIAKGSGELVLMFDNQFSWWTDKLIDFEVTRVRPLDSSSPSAASEQAGLHVGAAGDAARSVSDGNKADEVDATGAISEAVTGTSADQAAQVRTENREESRAAEAKRLWEEEAETARARWREQETETSGDDSVQGEEPGSLEEEHGEEKTEEIEQDTEKGEQNSNGLQKPPEPEGEEPLRDKAWAVGKIEKGKEAEAAGDHAVALERFESALAALGALGESRPKLVTRIERLRKEVAEAALLTSTDGDELAPTEYQYAAQI